MKLVFIDTSALLSLVRDDDADHGRIEWALRRLIRDGARLATHSYVLVETGAIVRRRFGPRLMDRVADVVRASCLVVWIDEGLHDRAWANAGQGTRKGPGLVDWVSFLVMRELGIRTALALDRHFTEQGFEVLP